MSNPQITAVVSAEDHVSSVLRAIAQLADKVAKDLEKTGRTSALGSLPGQYDVASRAAEKHLSVLHRINAAFKTIAVSAGSYAAYKFPHVAAEAVKEYLPIEKEQIAMQAAGHYSEADMALLRKQQTDLAQKYGEKPEAVVHAQSEFVKRHMDAATAAAMTEEGVKLAKAIGTTAQRGAQILEGLIFGTGHHVTTPEEARRLGKRFADIAAVQNKQGAMSPDDIDQGWKYAAAATTAAHVSPEQAAATMMILKRERFDGSESGVFLRQLGARLMMPTNEGRVALQAAGIKYDDYVGAGKLNAKNLNLTFAENGLKELPAHEIGRLQKSAEAGAYKTKADFGAAVRDAYTRAFEDSSAKDLNVVGKKAGMFFEASKGQVDGAKLWEVMLQKMTSQQILEYLGVKQGAKGITAIQQIQAGKEYEDLLKNAGGTAERIAQERMQGLAAAIDRMTASYEDVKNQFVEANKPVLTALANLGTKLTGWLSSLDEAQKQTATYAAALASLAGGALGLKAAYDLSKKVLEALSGKTPSAGAAEAAAGNAARGGAALAGEAAKDAAPFGLPFLATPAGVAALGVGGIAVIAASATPEQQKAAMSANAAPDLLNLTPKNVILNGPGLPGMGPGMGKPGVSTLELANEFKLREITQPKPFTPPPQDGRFDIRPHLEKVAGDPTSHGGLTALLGAVQQINAKPVDVKVNGDVKGEAKLSMRVDPSPLFVAKMDRVEKIALQGQVANTGKNMSGPTGVTPAAK